MKTYSLPNNQLKPSEVYAGAIQAFDENKWELKKIIVGKDCPTFSTARVYTKADKVRIVVIPSKDDSKALLGAQSVEETFTIIKDSLTEYPAAAIIIPIAQCHHNGVFRPQHYILACISQRNKTIHFIDSKSAIFYQDFHEKFFQSKFPDYEIKRNSKAQQLIVDTWQCGHYVLRQICQLAGSVADEKRISADSISLLNKHGDLIEQGLPKIIVENGAEKEKIKADDFELVEDDVSEEKTETISKENFINELEIYLKNTSLKVSLNEMNIFSGAANPLFSARQLKNCLSNLDYQVSTEIIYGLNADDNLKKIIFKYQNFLPKEFQAPTIGGNISSSKPTL